ncbi:DUF2911 domain-containing protein [Cyclobacterium sp. 1_MG-2023]|uniref:DUF2911 domain-containing protein n=1 Tax=Cyclobacterium sp. 1_MG-2023 TaxID=3062681 RepID=UPI0026E39FBF|nr:DUF2911 domain-containing protein [Cyclobacterium sp. 1_MG-2023]MDO6438945.1 DUF2911 domain-containing protein [Cyclobacterium sp. 1_MG-2023]
MKNLKFKYTVLSLSILLAFTIVFQSQAQMQEPAPSPASFVSQNVGFTKISIDYSSPGVKGRTIFGDLVPYGSPWRAGANAPTTIEFSTVVNIGGQTLNAGKYSIFITPNQSGNWTIHFNNKGNAIYAYMQEGKVNAAALAKDDAVSLSVSPVKSMESKERLSYSISAEDNKVARVTFEWEKFKFSFEIDTQIDQKLKDFNTVFN